MPFNSYSNNSSRDKNEPTVNTYTPLTFRNPSSKVSPSRFSISYLNKMMVISISPRTNTGSNESFAKYTDSKDSPTIYLSYRKAKCLLEGIKALKEDKSINNVCIETNKGLLIVSNGVEYGSETPCIAIKSQDVNGAVITTVYQTTNSDSFAYNYTEDAFSSKDIPGMELGIFEMVLEQYYIANSYAVAATVRDAYVYQTKYQNDILRGIAGKVGVQINNGSGNYGSSQYNSSTSFLNNANKNSGTMQGAPAEYQETSFDDIAASMLGAAE